VKKKHTANVASQTTALKEFWRCMLAEFHGKIPYHAFILQSLSELGEFYVGN
jgi:hypothetical protein